MPRSWTTTIDQHESLSLWSFKTRRQRAMKKKPRRRNPRSTDGARYTCDACGGRLVNPVDLPAGESQEYVEDCPVCCRPNVIHVELEEGGEVRVWAEKE